MSDVLTGGSAAVRGEPERSATSRKDATTLDEHIIEVISDSGEGMLGSTASIQLPATFKRPSRTYRFSRSYSCG